MIQNIKVDLIYYSTASDFEMEFNLCGCCRMRLLTDKADDRKAFVTSLSKAVSRSKVIIACGNLFGDEGIIKTVAAAIGKTTVAADNKAYGINSSEDIEIIDGSVPLVTPEGIFGGCIIECGPQAIICLTDSKSVKKTLLKELIHPYISQLSVIPENDLAPQVIFEEEAKEEEVLEVSEEAEDIAEEAEDSNQEEQTEVSEEVIQEVSQETEEEVIEEASEEATEEVIEEASEETEESYFDDAENFSFITDEEESAEEDAEIEQEIADSSFAFDMHIEPEAPKRDAKSYYEYFVPNSEEDIFISEDEEFDNLKPNSGKLNAFIIIIAVLLLIMLAVIGYFLLFIPLSNGQEISTYINEFFSVSQNMLV